MISYAIDAAVTDNGTVGTSAKVLRRARIDIGLFPRKDRLAERACAPPRSRMFMSMRTRSIEARRTPGIEGPSRQQSVIHNGSFLTAAVPCGGYFL